MLSITSNNTNLSPLILLPLHSLINQTQFSLFTLPLSHMRSRSKAGLTATVVVVQRWSGSSVTLMLSLTGRMRFSSLFPQYFITAMFVGVCAVTITTHFPRSPAISLKFSGENKKPLVLLSRRKRKRKRNRQRKSDWIWIREKWDRVGELVAYLFIYIHEITSKEEGPKEC